MPPDGATQGPAAQGGMRTGPAAARRISRLRHGDWCWCRGRMSHAARQAGCRAVPAGATAPRRCLWSLLARRRPRSRVVDRGGVLSTRRPTHSAFARRALTRRQGGRAGPPFLWALAEGVNEPRVRPAPPARGPRCAWRGPALIARATQVFAQRLEGFTQPPGRRHRRSERRQLPLQRRHRCERL
jgi:hypothetical protein